MAGIIASSVSVTMTAGMTLADKTMSGYLVGEQIALSTTPAGATCVWSVAKPSGSTVRSDLSLATSLTPVFTPDVAGYYVVSVTVDGTTSYVLRASVTAVAITTWAEAMRLQPKLEAGVAAPATGSAVFHSSTRDRIVAKNSAGTVRELDPGARTSTFTLAGGTATITDSTVTANTVVAAMMTASVTPGVLTYTVTPGVGVAIASSVGTDGSTYRYSLIG